MAKKNLKRAFKKMDTKRKDDNRLFYQKLDSGLIALSDGCVVITVSSEEFEENKQYCKKSFVENDALKKIVTDNKNKTARDVKLTTVSILCGEKSARVVKSEKILGGIDEEYIQVLQDVGCSMIFKTFHGISSIDSGIIKTPLIEADGIDEKVYSLFAILPICLNVRDTLNHILK